MAVAWQVVKDNSSFKIVVERDGETHDLLGKKPSSFFDSEWRTAKRANINDAWFGVASMKYGYIRYEGILYIFDWLCLTKYRTLKEFPNEVQNAFSWLKKTMTGMDMRAL